MNVCINSEVAVPSGSTTGMFSHLQVLFFVIWSNCKFKDNTFDSERFLGFQAFIQDIFK